MFIGNEFVEQAQGVSTTTCGSRNELNELLTNLFQYASASEIEDILQQAIEKTITNKDFSRKIASCDVFLQVKLINFFNRANYILRKEVAHG